MMQAFYQKLHVRRVTHEAYRPSELPHCAMQVSVDTACSSALVATHLAVQHLRAHGGGALSGGVNLMLSENTTAAAQAAGMLTQDGRCKTLDAAADGYVRCEPNCLLACLTHEGSVRLGQGGTLSCADLSTESVDASGAD